MIDVCLLGTGGVMPLPGRWLSSMLIKYNGRMLLIDCGEGTQVPLSMIKWGIKSIDTILFTHYHADHIAGLPGLLLTIGNTGRTEPINLIGPEGLYEIVRGLMVISPQLPFELNIIELPQSYNELRAGDIIIKSTPGEHSITCLAYGLELKRKGKFDVQKATMLNIPKKLWNSIQRGEEVKTDNRSITPDMVMGEPRKGIKICYMTDTRPTDSLLNFIKDADLLVCEGMYGDESFKEMAGTKGHMLFSQAAQIAKAGNVKELWLTHFSPSLSEPEAYTETAKAVFENTVIGKDMMAKTLKFE